MSCPDCQKQGSRKALWIALLAAIAVGAIGLAELTGSARRRHEPVPQAAETRTRRS
jgi:hypothetical protein